MNKSEEQNKEYTERQKDWRTISVTQLSNANNILLTLSTGLLAFCFEKPHVSKIYIDTRDDISYTNLSFISSIILLGLSIGYGIAVLFSRLCDFRISRQIALTRQRTKIVLPDQDLGKFNSCDRIKIFMKVLFKELPFISKEEIAKMNDKDLKAKFNELRKICHILGTATWRWTKVQALLFLCSIFVYLTYLVLSH